MRAARVLFGLAVGIAPGFAQRDVTFAGFPLPVQSRLAQQGVQEQGFTSWLSHLRTATQRRERDGEMDHLIFFALQSRSFTALPPIEPALSAKEFHERGRIPAASQTRLRAFQAALAGTTDNERLNELRGIAKDVDLEGEYARAMRFLYAKEWGGSQSYAQRGLSTDTAFSINYVVWTALSVLQATYPNAVLENVLIIGPGLDFAPRTEFDESTRPQSFQPYAVLDALPAAEIHCYDVNDRVIRFISGFSTNRLLEIAMPSGDQSYWSQFGSNLGSAMRDAKRLRITVKPEMASRVTAAKHDVLTDPVDRKYDLAIATNILVYYDGAELTLALANIAAHLKPGGFLIHNDLRPELDGATHAAGLNAVAARTLQISATTFDSFAIYRR